MTDLYPEIPMREFIICAAIHFDDEVKREHQPKNIERGIVVAGRRHHNCYLTIFELNNQKKWNTIKHTQGFITSRDRFVDRKEGYEIAKREKQLFSGITHDDNPILISEELY
jgi:hypothetical protein